VDRSQLIPLCRQSLIAYAIAQWNGYRASWHHRKIAEALQRVARGECKRLIITMPPRHGKSMLASEFFPAWYFGHHPMHQMIHASYSQELVNLFGRKVRNQLRDDLYQAVFPNVTLSGDSQAADKFSIGDEAHGGAYAAVGVGGSATGRGAHLLLIDDPIKDREEADSERMRQTLKDWYTGVAYTRLMPGGAIVVIQTRWHEDDLAGWLLREHAHEGWETLSLPALTNDAGEPEDENPTRALWPESYPIDRLLKIRQTLPPRDWQALYMQRPREGTGALFKRSWVNQYDTVNASAMYRIMLVDPASEKRANNDFTSAWIVGLGEDENLYVLDMVRDRLNLAERAELVFRWHRKWKPGQVRYEKYGMQADVEHYKSEMNKRSYRFQITEVGGTTAKIDRIKRLVPYFNSGRIWLPKELIYTDHTGKPKDLVQHFIEEELLAFPVGRHDDMLDALARIAEPKLDLPWPSKQMPIAMPDISFGMLDAVTGY
jgi:predicted phage terminase large subunit-like protein